MPLHLIGVVDLYGLSRVQISVRRGQPPSSWFTIGANFTHAGGIYETHPRKAPWPQERFERTRGHCRRCHGPARLLAEVALQGKGRRSERRHDGRIQVAGEI